jgi:hypothetical protein
VTTRDTCPVCGTRRERSSVFCPRCGDHQEARASVDDEPLLAADAASGRRRRGPGSKRHLGDAARRLADAVGHGGPRQRITAVASLAGLAVLIAILALVVSVDRGRPADLDGQVSGEVVTLPPALDDPEGPDPVCVVATGRPCARPVVHGRQLAAVRVGFGAVVVDDALTLRRVRVAEHASSVTWTNPLAVDDATSFQPSDVVLARTGNLVLVGEPSRVHAVDSDDGRRLWTTALGRATGGAPWAAWRVGDHVMAVAGRTLVSFDAADGALRWSRTVPAGGVTPLATGAAVRADGRVEFVAPDRPTAVWEHAAPLEGVRVAGTPHAPAAGPVVLTGTRAALLDAADGSVIEDLGERARAAALGDGRTAAVVWDETSDASTLRLWGADGQEQVRQSGPPVACCEVELRPLYDGRVAVLAQAAVGEVVGWVVDARDGRVSTVLRRPQDTAWQPVAIGARVAVWRDGAALVGADPATGTPSWRAPQDVTVLLEGPLLLATRDALVRP